MKNIFEKYKLYGFKIFIKFAAKEIRKIVWYQLIRKSYSNDGEDIIIDKILGNKKKGFYIDVGAYDPTSGSNTKRFYDRGWSGINIEPSKENFKKFLIIRKRDINLNIGIGKKNAKLRFYHFFPETLSTFSQKEAEKNKNWGYKYLGEEIIPVWKLSEIFNKYCKKKKVDFLSIDTEGYDLAVLESNNWKRFKPQVICIETSADSTGFNRSKFSKKINIINRIDKYLISVGYKKIIDIGINSIYKLII